MNLNELVSSFKNYKIGFVAFIYTNSHNETAKVKINVGFKYGNILKADLETLHTEIKTNPQKYMGTEYSVEQFNNVVLAIEKSLSQPEENRSQGQKEAYVTLTENGALKYNMAKQSIKLFGVLAPKDKIVLQEGVYPVVNSRPETLLRKKIEKDLKKSRMRCYTLENIQSLNMNGEILEISL